MNFEILPSYNIAPQTDQPSTRLSPGDDHKYAAETGLVLTTGKKQIVGKLETMLTDLRSGTRFPMHLRRKRQKELSGRSMYHLRQKRKRDWAK